LKWTLRNKDIAHIFTRAWHDYTQAIGLCCRKVLQTVHSQVDTSFLQGALNFSHKHPIATNLCEWNIADTVASSVDLD
jgi:hypothetical protein